MIELALLGVEPGLAYLYQLKRLQDALETCELEVRGEVEDELQVFDALPR